jgi:hypothetical protein
MPQAVSGAAPKARPHNAHLPRRFPTVGMATSNPFGGFPPSNAEL